MGLRGSSRKSSSRSYNPMASPTAVHTVADESVAGITECGADSTSCLTVLVMACWFSRLTLSADGDHRH